MKFFKDIFASLKNPSLHQPLQQDEREAIIDLLLLGIYYDDHLSLGESEEFRSVVNSIGWESELEVSGYINNAILRVRSIRSSDETCSDFIRQIAKRLTSAGSRERALKLLNRLFRTDGKTNIEKAFFQQVEAAFNASA